MSKRVYERALEQVVQKCLKRYKPTDTVATTIGDLTDEVARLQTANTTLVQQLAALTDLNVGVVIGDAVPPPPPPDQAPPRDEVVDSLTWEEVMVAAKRLAGETHKPADRSASEIATAFFTPLSLLEPTSDSAKSSPDRLLYEAPDQQYDDVTKKLKALRRKWLGKRERAAAGDLKLEVAIIVQPSQFFVDFLAVFDRASMAAHYPHPKRMEDRFFVTRNFLCVDPENKKPPRSTECKDYALDIPHVLAGFGSLFSLVDFSPVENVSMERAFFTDTELLIHFSLRYHGDGCYHEAYLRDPGSFYEGDNVAVLSKAIASTIDFLLDTVHRHNLIFARDSKGGISLCKPRANDTGSSTNMFAPIPDVIMDVLKKDIYDNLDNYSRRKQIASFTSPDTPAAPCSPLTKLLNYDSAATGEFSALYNKLPRAQKPSYSTHASDVLPTMKCVNKVFYHVFSAACAIACVVGRDKPSLYLAKTVRCDKRLETIAYASSTSAFPGLLFYAFMGVGNRDMRSRGWFGGERKPVVLEGAFFDNNRGRVAFWNFFGAFSDSLASLPGRKPRITSFDTVRSLVVTRAKDLACVQSTYTSNLTVITKRTSEWGTREDLRRYFSEPAARTTDFLDDVYDNIGSNFHHFYTNPIGYRAAPYLKDMTKVKSSSSSSFLHDMLTAMDEREIARKEPAVDESIVELTAHND